MFHTTYRQQFEMIPTFGGDRLDIHHVCMIQNDQE